MKFQCSDLLPEPDAVLQTQGVLKGATVQQAIYDMVDETFEIFTTTARPEGLLANCSIDEFENVFVGEGKNADDNPLETIFPKAGHLALFALTMGNEVSSSIQNLFEDNEFALGAMLDTVASQAADKAVEVMENYFFNELLRIQPSDNDLCVLSYSPGYCGWDISGQKTLFLYLQPDRIGITLNDSYLMSPLKSVTGLLVAGKKEIHIFKSNYPFCSDCRDRSCQERMKKILDGE